MCVLCVYTVCVSLPMLVWIRHGGREGRGRFSEGGAEGRRSCPRGYGCGQWRCCGSAFAFLTQRRVSCAFIRMAGIVQWVSWRWPASTTASYTAAPLRFCVGGRGLSSGGVSSGVLSAVYIARLIPKYSKFFSRFLFKACK